MKYVVDIDALINCIDFLDVPSKINGNRCVYVEDVKNFIQEFPKDKLTDCLEIISTWNKG